jgi:hypothetical protein
VVYDKTSLQRRRCLLIKMASAAITTTSIQNTNDGSPYKVLHFVNNGISSKHTDITFYWKDCITGMQAYLQDKSVDVCVTSPPYNIGVDYGDGGYDDNNKPENEYLEWIERISIEIKRVLKDDGSFFF